MIAEVMSTNVFSSARGTIPCFFGGGGRGGIVKILFST